MINKYFKELSPPGTIIQVGEADKVFETIKHGDEFDVSKFVDKYKDKNLYFLAGLNPNINTSRASDKDVLKKNYFVIDFDIRDIEKKSGNDITDEELGKIIDIILDQVSKDEYLKDYYMAVNSGNGLHLHYLDNEIIPITNKHEWKEGIKSLFEYTSINIYPVDTGCSNVGRLFRIPTSYNNKGESKEVKVVKFQGTKCNKINKIIDKGKKELVQIEGYRKKYEALKQERIAVNGEGDVIENINKIDITKLVSQFYPVKYNEQDNRFYHLFGEKKGFSTGYFKDKEGNYVVWTGSSEIPEHVQGDPMAFIKAHLGHSSYKETIDWFKSEYSEIKDLADEEKKEWIKGQNQQSKENLGAMGSLVNDKPVSNEMFENLGDIFNTEYGEYEYLINNFIPREGVTCISARAKQGKSWLVLKIIISLLNNETLFGGENFASKQSKVMLIDEENSKRGLHRRLKKLVTDSPHVVSLHKKNFDLFDEKWRKLLVDKAMEEKPNLIIFDSYRRIIGGRDEDSASVINESYIYFKEIMNTVGCAILFTDHIKKQDPRMSKRLDIDSIRGSSDKAAICESIIMLSTTPKRANGISFNSTKVSAVLREAEPLDVFEYQWQDDDKGMVEFTYKGTVSEEMEKAKEVEGIIKEYFGAFPESLLTHQQIVDKVGDKASINPIKSAIASLKKTDNLNSKSIKSLEKEGQIIDMEKYPEVKSKATNLYFWGELGVENKQTDGLEEFYN